MSNDKREQRNRGEGAGGQGQPLQAKSKHLIFLTHIFLGIWFFDNQTDFT